MLERLRRCFTTYLSTDQRVLDLHRDVDRYASRVAQVFGHEDRVKRHPYSGGALRSLGADQLGFHRALLDMCSDGWVSAAAPLLRTMHDILISAAVVVEVEAESEYRGFKYSYGFLKEIMNDLAFTPEQQADSRKQIENGMKDLPDAFKQKARDFMFKEKCYAYWYYPDFKRPSEVVEKLFAPAAQIIYDRFSGGAHGGYLGLRMFKDFPDEIHPNPRKGPRSQMFALGGAIRFTIDTFRIIDRFMGRGDNEGEYKQILDRMGQLVSP